MTASTLATKDDLKMLEIRFQAFVIKLLVIVVSVLGGLQTILHFT